jgi:patatin-like phospholipase/acyl hydrolase
MNSEIKFQSRQPKRLTSRPFQILCLSGGGYRGLYTATLLEKLEAEARKPLSQVFDLIAGTSIGGILGLGLAARKPASQMKAAFEKNGAHIFPTSYRVKGHAILPRLRTGIFKARYPQDGLRETLSEVLGDLKDETLQSEKLGCRVLITCVNVTSRSARLFRSTDPSCAAKLIDIGLSTSAAPTYFPEHSLDSAIVVDGGLVANAPDMLAVMDALRSQKLENIRVLSLGTAGREGARAFRDPGSPGIVGSAKDTFLLTLDAQEQISIQATADLLGDRYLRLDTMASEAERKEIGLDMTSTKAAKTLQMMAARTWDEQFPAHQSWLRETLNRSRP